MSGGKRWIRYGLLGLVVGVGAAWFTATWLQQSSLRNEVALAKSQGLPVEPADLRRVELPEDQNAYPDLLRAWALLHSRFLPEGKRLEGELRGFRLIGPYKLGAQEYSDLARLQPVVQCLHEAALKPRVDFHRRWEDGPETNFDFADIRTCVRLLLSESRLSDHLGKTEEGTQECADAARLCALVADEPDLNAAFTTLACESIVEGELELWLWNSKIQPGISRRIRRVVQAMQPLPDVRHALSGQLVLEREGIQALARASTRSLVFQAGRMRSLRFAHMQQVRDAYDIRVLQVWRAMFKALPPDDSNLMAVHRSLATWEADVEHRQDWTLDYLHGTGVGLSSLAAGIETQLARQRVLLTLGDLLELKAAGKPFDGQLTPEEGHVDPCTGKLLHVIPIKGGWTVYSLGPEQFDFSGSRAQGLYANARQNIVVEYPEPKTPRPPPKRNKGKFQFNVPPRFLHRAG